MSEVKSVKLIKVPSRENNLKENKILDWVRLSDRYGENIFRKQSNLKTTPDFKETMVQLILEKGVPLSRVLIDYRISCTALENRVRLARNKSYRVGNHRERKNRRIL